MNRRICVLLVLTLLLLVAVPMAVSGEETEYDWDSIDFETFDFRIFNGDYELYCSFRDWLEHDSEFDDFFAYAKRVDGFYSSDFASVVYRRFLAEPKQLLIALAQEENSMQERIVLDIVSELGFKEADIPLFTSAVEGLRLNKETEPEAVRLMLILIEEAQLRLGVSITAPPTGDPVMLSVLGLVCSSAGMLLLKKRKRTD